MELGLTKDEVKVVPYDTRWAEEFVKVKRDILQYTLLQENQIEHIGSTAIIGMPAKPVIDLLIGVDCLDALDRNFFSALKKAGFYRLRVERPNEIVCAKFTDETFETKTHFIHIVDFQKEKWQQLLFFRDFLNSNERAKMQYEALKKNFFSTNLNGIVDYTNYKEQFVQAIFDKMS